MLKFHLVKNKIWVLMCVCVVVLSCFALSFGFWVFVLLMSVHTMQIVYIRKQRLSQGQGDKKNKKVTICDSSYHKHGGTTDACAEFDCSSWNVPESCCLGCRAEHEAPSGGCMWNRSVSCNADETLLSSFSTGRSEAQNKTLQLTGNQ